ncbi:MAG TPA: hypothetical protein VK324_08635, partial [Tepidisphaeraceae bacterium]|nr:hypothetical protein [Tepidisphaeraceae bacterium]
MTQRIAHVYLNRRMAALLGLGFASGLPYVLVTDVLQAWAKDAGVDVGAAGLFGLLLLPYTL